MRREDWLLVALAVLWPVLLAGALLLNGCGGAEFQGAEDGSFAFAGGGVAGVALHGTAGVRSDGAQGGVSEGGSPGGFSGSVGDIGGQQASRGGVAGALGDGGASGGAGGESSAPDCSLLPVWVDDEPLPLQAGDLVQSHGFVYRALRDVRYAIPGCDPFEPVDCEWFVYEGECE